MSSSIHQTVSSATFLKSIQYHLCVGCHPQQQSGHLSPKQILLENKGHQDMEAKDAGHTLSLGFLESVGIKYFSSLSTELFMMCSFLLLLFLLTLSNGSFCLMYTILYLDILYQCNMKKRKKKKLNYGPSALT